MTSETPSQLVDLICDFADLCEKPVIMAEPLESGSYFIGVWSGGVMNARLLIDRGLTKTEAFSLARMAIQRQYN